MRGIRTKLGGALAAAILCAAFGTPASAVSMKECSAKYKAAKADGSLGGEDWKTFRAKQCTAVTPAATTQSKSGAVATAPATVSKSTTPASSGAATFPTTIDPKYAKETPGKGRMHTCLDQYKANKASSANGGLRWVQKGGGYYSACSKKLKG